MRLLKDREVDLYKFLIKLEKFSKVVIGKVGNAILYVPAFALILYLVLKGLGILASLLGPVFDLSTLIGGL